MNDNNSPQPKTFTYTSRREDDNNIFVKLQSCFYDESSYKLPTTFNNYQ